MRENCFQKCLANIRCAKPFCSCAKRTSLFASIATRDCFGRDLTETITKYDPTTVYKSTYRYSSSVSQLVSYSLRLCGIEIGTLSLKATQNSTHTDGIACQTQALTMRNSHTCWQWIRGMIFYHLKMMMMIMRY